MCLVSFVPLHNGLILTSNRDESILRPPALKPAKFKNGNIKMVYPVDQQSQGTWIGYNSLKTMAVLLNGGYDAGIIRDDASMSRGLIIPKILSVKNALNAVDELHIEKFNPFTLILFYQKNLYEFRWDGLTFSKNQLSTLEPILWNSSTLYSKEVEKTNQLKFYNSINSKINEKEILLFHQLNKYEYIYEKESLVNNIKTLSTTQIIVQDNSISIEYKQFFGHKTNAINLM